MPHEQMNEQQVAAYLNMDVRELVKLCCRGQIPCRKVGARFAFSKGDVDHWVETQMHRLDKGRLAGIEKGVSAHHGFETGEMMVCSLIPSGGLAVPLEARTRDAVIRGLVDTADKAGLVCGRDELIEEIRRREELCSTSLIPGVAWPHPRHPLPYDIVASFVVVGLTSSGIPYGAVDGSLTRLFFLICSKDDRTHLHVLARLAQMLHEGRCVEELFAVQDAEQMRQALTRQERAVLTAAN